MIEYKGKKYCDRHGGPFDRGMADSYYGRRPRPHFFTGATNQSVKVPDYGMSEEAKENYWAGYYYNEEELMDKKEY